MSEYTFLPWMRRGLANQLKDPAGVGSSRARLEVSVTIASDAPGPAGAPVIKPIKLVWPGDILGMSPRQVIRTEPRAGTSDYEPNYLAAVDFYDEDFLWRYSPFALQPPGQPSPSIRLTAKARKQDIFPPVARELLWNEFPTDMQGSYFRQFWDVSRVPLLPGESAKDHTERLKDIRRMHEWDRKSVLGSHNQRDAQGDASQVILVIRGDLLKRYPNTAIYAQQAKWSTEALRKNRLVLSDESGDLVKDASSPLFRFPLYHAFVAPDIYFIGFDLTLEEVRGDAKLAETAEAQATVSPKELGWFFVLQEIVGEPRFGMDVAAPTEPAPSPSWNDLSWVDVDLSGGEIINLTAALLGTARKSRPGGNWGDNAADMANILYQEPVMVGIHGREMLKNLTPLV